jgi:hypothetical protein
LLAPDRLNRVSRTCWRVSLFGCVVDAMLRESSGVIILEPLSEWKENSPSLASIIIIYPTMELQSTEYYSVHVNKFIS